MRESKDQTLIGCLLISGIPIFAAGLVLYFMLEGAGALRYLHTHGNSTTLRLAPMALLLCVLGGLVSLAGVVLGLRRAFPNHRKAIRRTLPDVYVVSRMILDRRLQPAFEPEFAETPLHYFVQLREVALVQKSTNADRRFSPARPKERAARPKSRADGSARIIPP